MTAVGVGSGALLGLSERTAFESRNASGKEKPVCCEGCIWRNRREEVEEYGRPVWQWATQAESFESTSGAEYLLLYDVR